MKKDITEKTEKMMGDWKIKIIVEVKNGKDLLNAKFFVEESEFILENFYGHYDDDFPYHTRTKCIVRYPDGKEEWLNIISEDAESSESGFCEMIMFKERVEPVMPGVLEYSSVDKILVEDTPLFQLLELLIKEDVEKLSGILF